MADLTIDPVDRIRKIYSEAYRNIESIINHATLQNFSDDGEEPEFMPQEKVDELEKEYGFPLEIKLLLNHPQNSNQMTKYNNFTFYNMNQILSNIKHYKTLYNHERFLDIGQRYHGMGHWVVLSWDKIQKKFFFRLDGGADGWQRSNREEFFFTNFNPEEEKYQNRMLDWIKARDMIISDEIYKFDNLIFAQ